MVDLGVLYTSLMMISYSDSEIETSRDSLWMKMIKYDLIMSYIISKIETGRDSLRIMVNERRREVPA